MGSETIISVQDEQSSQKRNTQRKKIRKEAAGEVEMISRSESKTVSKVGNRRSHRGVALKNSSIMIKERDGKEVDSYR